MPAPTHSERARRTVQTLLVRMNALAVPGALPESAANRNRTFLFGWLDAIRYTSPEALDPIGAELRDRICAGALNAEESIMVAHVFQLAPETSSPDAFECFFTRFSAEDTPLWAMLDAWRVSGMEPIPALERIKTAAVDSRTHRRFDPSLLVRREDAFGKASRETHSTSTLEQENRR